MKGLKKLALAAAVAAAPFAQAELTAMDDSFLDEMTGQAGVSIDIDLAMSIGEIRYVDSDGHGAAGTQGTAGLTNLNVGRLDATGAFDGTDASVEINGITIDADATEGLVIGFGQIGVHADGVDVSANFQINGQTAGRLVVEDFTNQADATFVPTLLAQFGYQADNTQAVAAYGGATTAQFLSTSPYIPAELHIRAGGADGTQGLTVDAEFGGIIGKMAFEDDGRQIGMKNVAFFNYGAEIGDNTDGAGTGAPDGLSEIVGLAPMSITGLTIDVVDRNGRDALALGNVVLNGTIAIGEIFIGEGATGGSLGGLLIKDISLQNTTVYVYAH